MASDDQRATVTCYIALNDAAAAIDFYRDVFGAEETGARFTEPSGKIGHAELSIGNTTFYLSDEYPDIDVLSPRTLGGSHVALMLNVADAEAVVTTAVAHGATLRRAVEDRPYGERGGEVLDPFGYRWMISQHVEDVGVDELQRRVGDEYKIS